MSRSASTFAASAVCPAESLVLISISCWRISRSRRFASRFLPSCAQAGAARSAMAARAIRVIRDRGEGGMATRDCGGGVGASQDRNLAAPRPRRKRQGVDLQEAVAAEWNSTAWILQNSLLAPAHLLLGRERRSNQNFE